MWGCGWGGAGVGVGGGGGVWYGEALGYIHTYIYIHVVDIVCGSCHPVQLV